MARRSRAEILATHDWRRYNAKTPETKCRCEICKADWSQHCSEYVRSSPAVQKRQAVAARGRERLVAERNQTLRREAELQAINLGVLIKQLCDEWGQEPSELEVLSPPNRRAALLRIEVVFPF